MYGLKAPHFYLQGMSHESTKSPSLGMISTATRTTATVSPLSPLTNGSAIAQSANSGFAAALRKLAKQAEDPRGSAHSGDSSPVSSPATSHSSPVTTPKRASLGPLLAQSRGPAAVPSAPPVVTIAPTKISNGLWRADGRQAEPTVQRLGRERGVASTESAHPQQDKGTPPIAPPHSLAHPFGLTPSSVMQDPRMQSLSLPGQMHPAVPSGAVPEEYLRALRPFATTDDLRMTSVPLSLDPAIAAHAAAAAAAAAAYYHPAFMHHPLSLPRMEESLCMSALRSQFYSVPAGGAFPPLHHSGLHLHLPGGRYPGELNHSVLAERLQMENELRQREREHEREREKEREREAGLEREREREEERERELLDRQKERQRERQQQMVRASESHGYLAEVQPRRAPLEDRARTGERLTPNRLDKPKESEPQGFPAHKPFPLNLHSSRGSVPPPVPSLVPSHLGKHHTAPGGGIHGALASAMMTQRANEEAWLTRQRGHDREGPTEGKEPRKDSHRTAHHHVCKDGPPALGAPPPLISPKAPPPPPPTTLWNPASLVDSSTDSRRKLNPPIRPPPGLTRADRPHLSWGEKMNDGLRRRTETPERCPSARGGSLQEANFLTKTEKELLQRHHMNNLHLKLCTPLSDPASQHMTSTNHRDSLLVYDEVLQQHRRLLSKLDMEEKRRREAREGGYYYDLNESYDESDEEEVKAHLRRVTEQPPLKLDTSSEKVDFLHMCSLVPLARRDEILQHKKRKRRRMLRERSPSPPVVQGKKKASPLTTPYTAEQMDGAPELPEKKDFLRMFKLSHVSPQQRRDKEKTEELLKAIQKNIVTLDTLRYNSTSPCSSPLAAAASSTGESSAPPPSCQSNGHLYLNSPSPSPPYLHKHKHTPHKQPTASVPPPLASQHQKAAFTETNKRPQLVHNGHAAVAPLKKEPAPGQNGRIRPWERFTPEAFAQHFHQAVLQSTHNTQHKGIPNWLPEASVEAGVKANFPPLKAPHVNHTPSHVHVNGHHLNLPRTNRDAVAPLEHVTDDEDEVEEDNSSGQEDDEVEEPARKWNGIEAIFEAYQDYVDERSVERQVLHSQCKRLEAQNFNLTRTAEQLSITMAELVSQRQRVREERDRLQAQLEHFRRCLTLPSMHWGRGQINGHAPR
uniref:genetic suppressor element 1-like isoform X2 n=1 Tax=Doryrhamphus excisus TaxID=161450 RepID=UPI0025AE689B|nr:genetic suppressor element 1-like isoform X2 [Doryrhamphus excisus]